MAAEGTEKRETPDGAATGAASGAPQPGAAGDAAGGAAGNAAGDAPGNAAGSIPPTREDGSPWPVVNGKKPGDPYYGVELEQMEWAARRQRRYSFVLAIQIAFLVAVVGIIIYYIATA